ncbi:MAG: ABC transporter substrate-binding protein [Microbacterium sp.]|uniref:ABC transporter substrate-binding protein n=1 Tax=Microbacterium sp. TaxID=51671 RepID=UPI002612A925|nr:ABC transporter substrate-binding protein [Microbacterium sp.]MCX6501831.1 ABC transporter substrate-binding protein [Microbacterium sp.]
MLRRTLVAATALVAAAALTLTACSGTAPTEGTGSPDPDASVVVRLVLEPTNLDIRQTSGAALDQLLIDNVYQGLVSRTPEQEIEPALASDWTVSDDGLTYTFTVQDGVTFHDGQELTPQDVVWSLTQHRDNADWVDASTLAKVTGIAAEGQNVTLTLSEPDSQLLWNLSGRAGIILKEGDGVDYQTAANGTGPFTLTAWAQGDSVTLTRYDGYWGTPSEAAEVIFDYIPDNQAALSAALAGELDVVTGLALTADIADQLSDGGDFTIIEGESTDKGTLAFNQTTGPLADQRVRQAIRQAIDHEAFVEALGGSTTLYGPIPALDPGYEDLSDVAPYDPDAAEKLLADAGYEDLTLTLTIPSFYPTTIAQLLVSDLDQVGITLKVDSVDFATWLQDVYTNKDYELSFVLHTEARDFGNWADPDYYFTYDNAEVQTLFAQSLTATSDEEADELLTRAARIVSEDAAADWLFNGLSLVAVGTTVSGMPADSVNERLNVAQLTKSDG